MARKTKQEAQETRHHILDAAEKLFLLQGVSHTSLQDIAAEAQVTRGAIYWHFKDKAELFDAMMERATMPLEQGLAQNEVPGQPMNLLELRWGLVNIFYATTHNERTRRAFEIVMEKVEFTGEMQALHERKQNARRQWRERNRVVFDHAVRLGELPATLDTQTAAVALSCLVDGLLHQWVTDPECFDLMQVGTCAIEDFLSQLANKAAPLLPPLTAEETARLGQRALGLAPEPVPGLPPKAFGCAS